MAEYMRDRELRKADYNQRRWSNREQAEFYRTVSTFGVEYDRYVQFIKVSSFIHVPRILARHTRVNLTNFDMYIIYCFFNYCYTFVQQKVNGAKYLAFVVIFKRCCCIKGC